MQELPKKIQVSLLIPAKNSFHCLEQTVAEVHRFLLDRYQNSFEIILIPTKTPSSHQHQDPSIALAQSLSQKFSNTYTCLHTGPLGKGAALRNGFFRSRGKWIFITDADLPYHLDFFDCASQKLREGYEFISGNRRLQNSQFQIPVQLLPLAYKRHQLGLLFNRFVRILFPITSLDTQAGIKAMTREFAHQTFSKIQCPGFFFDVEVFLIAKAHSFPQVELPVTLYLRYEKTTIRLFREAILSLYWLLKIKLNFMKNHYAPCPPPKTPLRLYPKTNLLERFFLWARWKWTPYRQMAALFPVQGRVLDFGCGHGLFSFAIAEKSKTLRVYGIDHDARRIELAQSLTQGLKNIEFEVGNFDFFKNHSMASTPWSGMAMIDVLHYFPHLEQKNILEKAYLSLEPGGKLLFREVAQATKKKAVFFNRIHETLMTQLKFTKANSLYFRPTEDWKELAESIGFKVEVQSQKRFPFSDVLFICQRSH